MTTLASALAALATARERFRDTVGEISAAAWERQSTSSTAEAWSPRQVAEHVLASDWYFAGAIARATGNMPPVRPEIETQTPANAIAVCEAGTTPLASLLAGLSDRDLPKPMPAGFPPDCGVTVAETLAIWVQHIDEHIAQMVAAAAPR